MQGASGVDGAGGQGVDRAAPKRGGAKGYGFERLLPLDLQRINSIAVFGPHAAKVQFGHYMGEPANPPVYPLEGIQSVVGDRVRVRTTDWAKDDEAVGIAKTSDVVVLVLGLHAKIEAEGIDRKTLELPPDQSQFLKKILDANPITILVLVHGGPVSLPSVKERVPAILTIWYPGERGGTALAEVLLGQYNPSGRLPMTFYADVAELPPLADYEIDKGRTYMYLEKPAVYPFGHGLSYTSFAYSNLRIEPATTAADRVIVTCDVANTGGRDGEEVVQLYVHKMESPLKRPLKQLKGFARVAIPAGQSRTVHLELPVKDLGFWDVQAHAYVVEPGTYEILAGASSADIRLRGNWVVR